MAIKNYPGDTPLKFTDLLAEFGSDGSPFFSDYFRGGALVADTQTNIAIAAAGGTLRLSQFYGATKPPDGPIVDPGGSGLSVTISPSGEIGASRNTPGPLTAGPAEVTVSGGTGPYTYLWSSSGDPLVIDNPTSSSTTFSGEVDDLNNTAILATVFCTVSDSAGHTLASASRTVRLRYTGIIQ